MASRWRSPLTADVGRQLVLSTSRWSTSGTRRIWHPVPVLAEVELRHACVTVLARPSTGRLLDQRLDGVFGLPESSW